MLVGVSRVRNESLIISDTVRHFLRYCRCLIIYDDYSEDDTAAVIRDAGGYRVQVIQGENWRVDRRAEETRHRALLLERAKELGADWVLCFDADERLWGPFPDLEADGADAYAFRLFDGYLTERRQIPYRAGSLANLPRLWGPEYRDIVMLFRPERARFIGLDRREPHIDGAISLAQTRVKHFGKCLSVEHWEETCDYYANHWPEPYRSKWRARKGKAIHNLSDFGRRLYRWRTLMESPDKWQGI